MNTTTCVSRKGTLSTLLSSKGYMETSKDAVSFEIRVNRPLETSILMIYLDIYIVQTY